MNIILGKLLRPAIIASLVLAPAATAAVEVASPAVAAASANINVKWTRLGSANLIQFVIRNDGSQDAYGVQVNFSDGSSRYIPVLKAGSSVMWNSQNPVNRGILQVRVAGSSVPVATANIS